MFQDLPSLDSVLQSELPGLWEFSSHELLATSPSLILINDFLSVDLIEILLSKASDGFERSQVNPFGEITKNRTSSTAYLSDQNDPELNLIRGRAARLLGVSIDQIETLQVTKYSPGEQFGNHFDFFPSNTVAESDLVFSQGGQRTHTILVYLNDMVTDEIGGRTIFPKLNLAVIPRKGAALVWRNALRMGYEDYRTVHRGEAPQKGEKIVLSIWVREGIFISLQDALSRQLESANKDGDKSRQLCREILPAIRVKGFFVGRGPYQSDLFTQLSRDIHVIMSEQKKPEDANCLSKKCLNRSDQRVDDGLINRIKGYHIQYPNRTISIVVLVDLEAVCDQLSLVEHNILNWFLSNFESKSDQIRLMSESIEGLSTAIASNLAATKPELLSTAQRNNAESSFSSLHTKLQDFSMAIALKPGDIMFLDSRRYMRAEALFSFLVRSHTELVNNNRATAPLQDNNNG